MSEQPRCTCEPNYGYVGPCCKTCPRCTERQAALKAAEAALDALRAQVPYVLAQLRHAYLQLTASDHTDNRRVSRRGMKDFADGLLAPQIRKLESLTALLDPPSGGPQR